MPIVEATYKWIFSLQTNLSKGSITHEKQNGVPAALGLEFTIHQPGARVEDALIAGKIVKDRQLIGINKPVSVINK